MSRRTSKKESQGVIPGRTPARNSKSTPAPALSGHERFIHRLTGLPRAARILLAAAFALAVTLALSPIVDAVYLRFFFTPQTRLLPSLVSMGFGMVMYLVGWLLVVGTVGENPPARFMILWYFVLGLVAVLLALLWLAQGLSIASAT